MPPPTAPSDQPGPSREALRPVPPLAAKRPAAEGPGPARRVPTDYHPLSAEVPTDDERTPAIRTRGVRKRPRTPVAEE